jgi:mRNA interferase MazF
MRRGEIWTVADGRDYAGKPRPVVIVQGDSFDATDSITVCASSPVRQKRPCSACLSNRMTATD